MVDLVAAQAATNEAAPSAGTSDSEPSQDPTDVNDDANVSGDVLLELDEPIIGSQGSTSVTPQMVQMIQQKSLFEGE